MNVGKRKLVSTFIVLTSFFILRQSMNEYPE
jgi:hypothetical protein